jgi:MFS family permease
MIPVAVGVGIAAPLSARLTARFGSKVMVAAGLTVVALGLGLMSTATVESGYGLVATCMIVAGAGMGLAMTPATDAVMGAVPKDNAGVGSAVNDTTRQVGGALGVAVLGSLLATNYSDAMRGPASTLPPEVAAVTRDSVGAALAVAAQLGDPATALALVNAARIAFIDAMGTTLVIGAGVTLVGAAIALLFLPARAENEEASPEPVQAADEVEAPEEEPVLTL